MSKISRGAMEVARYDYPAAKTKVYRVACSCGDPSCDLTLELSFNKEDEDLDITFWREVKYYTDPKETKLENIIRKLSYKFKFNSRIRDILYELNYKISEIVCLWRRIKDAYKVIFNKEIKLEGGLIIYGEDNIKILRDVIDDGIDHVLSRKEDSFECKVGRIITEE